MNKTKLLRDLEELKGFMKEKEHKKVEDGLQSMCLYMELDMYEGGSINESLIEGMYGDMLVDKLNLLLKSEGCKSILDALEEKFGV